MFLSHWVLPFFDMKLHENLKTRFGEPGPGRTAASIKPHWGFWGLGMFSFFFSGDVGGISTKIMKTCKEMEIYLVISKGSLKENKHVETIFFHAHGLATM